MAKNKGKKNKKKNKDTKSEDKPPVENATQRKTRATRAQLISVTTNQLDTVRQELKELGLPQKKIDVFSSIVTLTERLGHLEKNERESNEKKSATIFMDVNRRCKEIKEENPQIDPSLLRDICISALDEFAKKLKSS